MVFNTSIQSSGSLFFFSSTFNTVVMFKNTPVSLNNRRDGDDFCVMVRISCRSRINKLKLSSSLLEGLLCTLVVSLFSWLIGIPWLSSLPGASFVSTSVLFNDCWLLNSLESPRDNGIIDCVVPEGKGRVDNGDWEKGVGNCGWDDDAKGEGEEEKEAWVIRRNCLI